MKFIFVPRITVYTKNAINTKLFFNHRFVISGKMKGN